MRNVFFTIPVLALILGTSCGSDSEKVLHSRKTVQLSAEGPLFEGANTLQGEMNAVLDSLLIESGIPSEQVISAKLTNAILACEDADNFGKVQAFTLHAASDNRDMLKLASVNPIDNKQKKASLTLAGEQDDLHLLLKENPVYLIGDVILLEEHAERLSMKCELEFEIKYQIKP